MNLPVYVCVCEFVYCELDSSDFIEMGIPSYFSHIIKNYSNIIRTLSFFNKQSNFQFEELYMDCNSIIYDSVYELEKKNSNIISFEADVIQLVILKIEEYIRMIRPRGLVYIAFDGVAPFAKMEQQRTRRYKSQFMAKIEGSYDSKKWNTSAITPGTKFMENLCKCVNVHFNNHEKKYNVEHIITSCSDECGEGEHKLFKYIRQNVSTRKVAVYGLDSDLIMLSIFHLKYCSELYIFREAPDFLHLSSFKTPTNGHEMSEKATLPCALHVERQMQKGVKSSIPVNVDNEPHFLDIKHLSSCINSEMACKFHEPDSRRTVDYIFMCFLLGNDFLPHFPAMNIRTHGIGALLDIYRKCIGNQSGRFLISISNEINWRTVKLLFGEIAKLEYNFLLNEYFVRDSFDTRTYKEMTSEEKVEVLKNVPILYRAEEKYICPKEPYWENRYYKTLLHMNREDVSIVCNNYLEGLEWVFRYYINDCPDWRWKYNYHYPPLFSDLVKYVPDKEHVFILNNNNKPFTSAVQLSYVLPMNVHHLMPIKISSILREKYIDNYPENYDFKWSFCRYFWEAHPILPEISIEQLECIETLAA